MAERRNESIIEWLEINTESLSGEEKIQLISELCDTMNPQELMTIEGIVADKRKGREEETRELLLTEFRQRAESMGMRLETLLRRPTQTAKAMYQSPDGKYTWSKRGQKPKWVRELEEQGHNIEEFRIK